MAEKQSRRRVMIPVSYRKLEQWLTGQLGKDVQVSGLPKDSLLINVIGKYDQKTAYCIFEHSSFDEVTPGQKLPILNLKSQLKLLPKGS